MLNIWNIQTQTMLLKQDVATWVEVRGYFDFFRTRYHMTELIICRYDEETDTYYFIQ